MNSSDLPSEDHTTFEAAKLLGLAVRSVQLMVDRGELTAWKTQGGHRRISHTSLLQWLESHPKHNKGSVVRHRAATPASGLTPSPRHGPKVLLIEDSIHYQNLVRLLMQEHFPDANLHVANEGFSGLAMLGMIDPEVLLLDMMLPGMDGSSLIGALRATPSFAHVQLIVITSMSAEELQKRSLVLKGVTVVPKTELMSRLPPELAQVLGRELERAGQHL